MIQIILIFVLGFLCAAFLALMLAPLFWRRAITLTRKRLEAAAPMSKSEIQADKDRLRAEFAVSVRKLELSAKSAREETAARTIEINRHRNELADLRAERAAQADAITGLETKVEELDAELSRHAEKLQETSQKLVSTETQLGEKRRQLDELGDQHEEMTFTASSRQIEIVARETDIENLNEDQRKLRSELDAAERRIAEVTAERNSTEDALTAEKTRSGELQEALDAQTAMVSRRDEKLATAADEFAVSETRLEEQKREHDDLNRLYEEASYFSSSRQIELVARETEIETLSQELRDMRGERKEAERLKREASLRTKQAEEARAVEAKRAQALEKKFERLMTTLSSSEEKLERREKELAEVRLAMKQGMGGGKKTSARLDEAEREKERLEARLAEMEARPGASAPVVPDDSAREAEFQKLSAKKDKLELRLAALVRENKKLRNDMGSLQSANSLNTASNHDRDAILRERISELAAEVVQMTARLEDPASPLHAALDVVPPETDGGARAEWPSLADRIRALQKAAAAKA